MAEMFVTALDAQLHAAVRTGRAKAKTRLRVPEYMKDPEAAKQKGLSGKALHDAVDAMMDRLGAGPS